MQVPTPPTAAEVEQALVAVYARPEFAPRTPSPILRWLGEMAGRAREFLAELFELLGGEGRAVSGFGIAVLGIAVVVVGAWLVVTARDAWRARERRRRREPAVAPPGPVGADVWERRAREAAAAARWREASLALYQALVLRLDEAGAVKYDPSKTPGDYRREARRVPGAARVFDAFLRPFEPIAFGGRAADAAAYTTLRAAAEEAGARG